MIELKLDDKQKEDIKMSLEKILEKDVCTPVKMNNILFAIQREIRDPIPEQIFKCVKCGNDIIAYGIRGEGFVTINNDSGIEDRHYHMKCV